MTRFSPTESLLQVNQSLLQMEEICNRFERGWQKEAPPHFESFFSSVSSENIDSKRLFRDLLQLDLYYRSESEETPSIDDYLAPFPEYADVVREVFETFHGVQTDTVHGDAVAPATFSHGSGDRLGRYEIECGIGLGGGGEVYQARTPEGDRVAIKTPRGDRSRTTLLREGEAALNVRHPNIVEVLEVGETDEGKPFLVMEYISGGSLEELLQKRALTPSETVRLISQCADALAQLHRKNIFHRDLKPANILLDENGAPRIADFDLALPEEKQLDRGGEYAGTAPYMSPEQVRRESQHLDGRTDVWSLGSSLRAPCESTLRRRRVWMPSAAVDTGSRHRACDPR